MITALKNFFKLPKDNTESSYNDLGLLCGLMMEAANIDGKLDQIEIKKISNALVDVFNENLESVDEEIKKCLDQIEDPKSLHFYTSKINKQFTYEKKITLIEILWEIILEDGKVHDFESNLIRRLAGLLYISDVDCGKAKRNVQNNN